MLLSYLAPSSSKHDESENESEEETSDCKLSVLVCLQMDENIVNFSEDMIVGGCVDGWVDGWMGG